jgi:hypothetical protein
MMPRTGHALHWRSSAHAQLLAGRRLCSWLCHSTGLTGSCDIGDDNRTRRSLMAQCIVIVGGRMVYAPSLASPISAISQVHPTLSRRARSRMKALAAVTSRHSSDLFSNTNSLRRLPNSSAFSFYPTIPLRATRRGRDFCIRGELESGPRKKKLLDISY